MGEFRFFYKKIGTSDFPLVPTWNRIPFLRKSRLTALTVHRTVIHSHSLQIPLIKSIQKYIRLKKGGYIFGGEGGI